MTPPQPESPIPDRIQRLLDERAIEAAEADTLTIVRLWHKAVNSDLDARESALSTDNRVGLAYQAGLQATFAYLAARGYRVKSTRSHHYYTFYAAQAFAESERNEVLLRATREIDAHRARRATAVYDAEAATMEDLADMLVILDTLLPAIRSAVLQTPGINLPLSGQRPAPA